MPDDYEKIRRDWRIPDHLINGGSYGSRPNQPQESPRVGHVLSVEAYNDIMRLYPSVGSRTLGDHLFDQETRRLGGALHLSTHY